MASSTRNSAPYGHACTACARAKCKCLRRPSSGQCQRCTRLNKECVQAPRKRTPKPPSRTAQLEQKVDGLLSLLNEAERTAQTGNRRPISAVPAKWQTISLESISEEPGSSHQSPDLDRELQEAHEQKILSSFRANKLPCFPFIYIPETATAAEVKKESPFLWRCIEAIESPSANAFSDPTSSLRGDISHALLVKLDKTLDLLQAVIAYLSWITHQSPPPNSLLCMFCQLANALVVELDLANAPPGYRGTATFNQISKGQGELQHLRPRVSGSRTMNERRALLSFFVLSSMISQYLGRMDPLRWTRHMSDCLDVLSHSTETPNDGVLVQLVRSRLVTRRMSDGFWNDNLPSDGPPRAPLSFYISALQIQLGTIRAEIPTELRDNKTVLLHLYVTEVTIYEPALQKSTSDDNDLKRLDHLYACLSAIKSFFDICLSIPYTEFASFPLTRIIQVAHCLVTLYRLSTLDLPGWDKVAVCRTADIVNIAAHIADKWIQAADIVDVEHMNIHRAAYSALGNMLHKIKDGWAVKLDPSRNDVLDRRSMDDDCGGIGDLEALFESSDTAWLLDEFFSGGIL